MNKLPHARCSDTILAILGAIFVVVVIVCLISAPRSSRARYSKTHAYMSNFKTALSTFQVDCDRFPTTLEGLDALIRAPAGITQWEGPYLDRIPIDEWGHPLRYTFPDPTDPGSYDLRSAGPDGIFDTADDIKKSDL